MKKTISKLLLTKDFPTLNQIFLIFDVMEVCWTLLSLDYGQIGGANLQLLDYLYHTELVSWFGHEPS